jgi:hypothetical protein
MAGVRWNLNPGPTRPNQPTQYKKRSKNKKKHQNLWFKEWKKWLGCFLKRGNNCCKTPLCFLPLICYATHPPNRRVAPLLLVGWLGLGLGAGPGPGWNPSPGPALAPCFATPAKQRSFPAHSLWLGLGLGAGPGPAPALCAGAGPGPALAPCFATPA